MVSSSKSTADAASLLGVAELYRGVAVLELVDMSRVTNTTDGGVMVMTDDQAKVQAAASHFRAAAEALSRATDVCSRARAKGGKQDPAMALDCDPAGFGKLSEIFDRIASRGATLPAPEDVQAAMNAISDELRFWKTSAQSLRGLAGHGPGKVKPRR
ncbi:MAG TPA: hypothetical protein VJA16_21245 [Thermoanaerobaculia bacterium]